ncbi:MAG: diadenylate cyclase [Puniceicoccales bacterium]|jgi:DNA integrity scanning protein DisA with diadenylate cyclase activity/mannitol/fructose-specific phosphotransferase system IIA component (Ntr-type)|nr:diadenylate cyclase [Puniceicoccales bacterium]
MLIHRLLSPARIVDLKSHDLQSAMAELLSLCQLKPGEADLEVLLEKLVQRERAFPTRVNNSIAVPHVRAPIKQKYVFAVGRALNGLSISSGGDAAKVCFVFLVVASDKEKSYHTMLTTLARALSEDKVEERLRGAASLQAFRAEVAAIAKGVSSQTSFFVRRSNQLILRKAGEIARGVDCGQMLLFADTFSSSVRVGRTSNRGIRTIIVTQYPSETDMDGDEPEAIVVRAFAGSRLSQLRSALLVGLMRGIIKPSERVCCVGGRLGSNKLDFVLAVDVANEFPSILSSRGSTLLPPNVKPEVFERALGIATELAIEGREGKPVGCILVIGDHKKIKPYTKPLILNPFFGYNAEDRNILSPFMDETVKELSSIDGAFIINGDGVIESAGSMLAVHEGISSLPGGLGTRHAAAAAITQAVDCVSIVVSSSTGQVTLFRRGEPLRLHDRSTTQTFQ